MLIVVATLGGKPYPTILSDARDKLIHDLISGFSTYGHETDYDSGFNEHALVALGHAADSQLIAALSDPSPRTRAGVAAALEKLATPKAATELRSALEVETEHWSKVALAKAYGTCAGAKAVPILASLAESKDPDVRVAAILGLGHTHSPMAIPAIAAHMVNQYRGLYGFGSTTYESGQALAEIGPASFPALKAIFLGKDADARVVAAEGLSDLDDPRAEVVVRKSIQNGTWPTRAFFGFRHLVHSDNSPLVLRDSNAPALDDWELGKLGEKTPTKLVPALIRTLRTAMNSRPTLSQFLLAEAVAWRLGQSHDRRALEPLRQAISSYWKRKPLWDAANKIPGFGPLHDSFTTAVTALGEFRDERSLKTFLKFLDGPRGSNVVNGGGDFVLGAGESTASAAAQACALLGRNGITAVAHLYRRRIVSPEAYAEALAVVDDKHALDVLVSATCEPNKYVQSAAIKALGTIKAKTALRQLHANPMFAEKTAEQLVRIGDVVGLNYYRSHRYHGPLSIAPPNAYDYTPVFRSPRTPMPQPLDAFATSALISALKDCDPYLSVLVAATLAARNVEVGWDFLRKVPTDVRRRNSRIAIGFLSRRPTGKNRLALLADLSKAEVRVRFEAYEALLGFDATEAAGYYTPID